MKIETVHEHSYVPELLPERAAILDLGCLGFEWYNYFVQLGHVVFPVDIAEFPGAYYRCGISNYDGTCSPIYSDDKQATRLGQGDLIPCYKLDTFSKKVGVEFWDLIKMDVEGQEWEIIMDMDKPPAKSLSIEFHCHIGQNRDEVHTMFRHLSGLGYGAVSHEWTEAHGAGLNYWDSLFTLK